MIGTQPKVVFEDGTTFDAADDMFDKHPATADLLVGGLLVSGQGLAFGFLGWHRDRHLQDGKPEIAQIL